MKYIDKSAIVAEIEKYISNYKGILNKVDKSSYNWLDSAMSLESKIDILKHILSFLDTLEVKEMPETTHTECKKIKKLCEIQRYDENGKEYSIMLPDTRLIINKINDIIEAIGDLDLRLQTTEALNIDYGKYKTEILERVRKVSCLIANKANVNFKRVDERLRKIEQRIGE